MLKVCGGLARDCACAHSHGLELVSLVLWQVVLAVRMGTWIRVLMVSGVTTNSWAVWAGKHGVSPGSPSAILWQIGRASCRERV